MTHTSVKQISTKDPIFIISTKVKVKVTQPCPTLCDPMNYRPWNSPGQNTGVGSLSLLQGNLPNPGTEPRSPTLQVDALPAEPQEAQEGTNKIL